MPSRSSWQDAGLRPATYCSLAWTSWPPPWLWQRRRSLFWGFPLDTCRRRWWVSVQCLVALFLLVAAGHAHQDAGKGVRDLLELATKAEPVEARRLLGKVVRMLADGKSALPAAERERLASDFRARLAEAVATPHQLEELMGGIRPMVARQVWYRHHREQWSYDFPLRFIVVVDRKKGQEARIQSVRPPPDQP